MAARFGLLKALLLGLIVATLTGCSSPWVPIEDEITSQVVQAPTKLMAAVSAEFPKCEWETFLSTYTFGVRSAANNSGRWFMEDLARGAREVESASTAQPTPAPSSDYRSRWYVCNSTGLSIAAFDQAITSKNLWSSPSLAWDADFWPGLWVDGWGGSCWVPSAGKPDKAELSLLKACERRIDDKTKPGFWFLIHEGKEFSPNVANFEKANLNFQETEAALPTAFVDQFTISVEAPFDYITRTSVEKIDSAWIRIVASSKATTASQILSGYPNTFDRAEWYSVGNKFPEKGTRMDLETAYELKFNRHLACNENLEISEFSYVPGHCGKLRVRAFQSDLSTGECMFLGKWTDKDGKQKTGLFEYCDAFRAGSVEEELNYKLKVRVQGQTSYVTKLGYENEVLSFTVIGEF